MIILKWTLPAAILTTLLMTSGLAEKSWAETQTSTPATDSMPARDAATSPEDIALTNSCIEGGKEKIYCLCVTKIFKHEMTLRQYRGAITVYGQAKTVKTQSLLTQKGYSENEAGVIKALSTDLTSENKFRTRCDKAETFFAASTQG